MIYKFNAHTFEPESHYTVKNKHGVNMKMLNELEHVNGKIWANIFGTDWVISFDADTGVVDQMIDFKSLLLTEKKFNRATNNRMNDWDVSNNVLNGIAYDPVSGDFFLTGKRWSLIFRVKINPQ